jgi:N-acetyl-anhydromuramyl-L-alanine amidase AmpD
VWRGWHYLPAEVRDERPPMDAATCLDTDTEEALRSPNVLIRPYFKGRPDPAALGAQLHGELYRGRRLQLGNEPNHPDEGFGGGPLDYAAWFHAVLDAAPPDGRYYYGAVSPGFAGWMDYFTDPDVESAIRRASGIVVHAYGDRDQMLNVVAQIRGAWPGVPLWVGECNAGAGQEFDIDAWAQANLRPFLDDCARIPELEAVCYFAYVWETPDMTLPTSVDGRGTMVETVLHDWRPPAEGGAGDIALSVPTETAIASPANYGPNRARTIGVVLHTTRGGGAPEDEYDATVAWFQNPAAGVSAHLVVGSPAPDRVARCVHDEHTAWHATDANADHLGIEICQSHDGDPISDFAYEAAAEACREWSKKYGFPLVRSRSREVPGLVGHEDLQAEKSDPGWAFDWDRFLALCTGAAPAPPDEVAALRDQVWAIADRLEQLGQVWYGQAPKSATAQNKGEA